MDDKINIITSLLIKSSEEDKILNLKNIINKINNLSHGLQYDIYNNFLVSKKLYNELMNEIKSLRCKKLEYYELSIIIKKVLSDTVVVNYLHKNNNIFNNIYIKHIINNDKIFKKMNNIDSFSLSWLMHLYH